MNTCACCCCCCRLGVGCTSRPWLGPATAGEMAWRDVWLFSADKTGDSRPFTPGSGRTPSDLHARGRRPTPESVGGLGAARLLQFLT